MPRKPLTAKQERFIAEYLIDLNATQAAIRAGYSRKTADVIAAQNLAKLKEYIAHAKLEALQRIGLDATQVLIRLADMADADIADILDEQGNYKPIPEWPVIWRRMLQSCDIEETFERSKDGGDRSWDKTGRVVKIKFVDRLKNLELLGRHASINAFALPVEKHEHVHIHLEVESRLTKAREFLDADVIETRPAGS